MVMQEQQGRKYNEITMDRRNKTFVTVKFSNYLKKKKRNERHNKFKSKIY